MGSPFSSTFNGSFQVILAEDTRLLIHDLEYFAFVGYLVTNCTPNSKFFRIDDVIAKNILDVLMDATQFSISEDWLNFLERMRKRDLSEAKLWELDDAYEIRLWASFRGQTLARTVRGMMYYERSVVMNIKNDTCIIGD